MPPLVIRTSRLDRIAIGLSGLCLVHCLASAIVLGLVSAAGGFLGAPIIHEAGLGLAMILGTIALGRGIIHHGVLLPSALGALGLGSMGTALLMPHGGLETLFTVVGVGILALAHRLNGIANA